MGWEDDRAVSEVLGAILLFGILVLAIGGYQSFVVPQQNAEIEHNHDKQVNDEFPEIQEAISNAAASGKQRTASITLGTKYPFRVFSISGPSPSGNLKTGEKSTISMENHDLSITCGLNPETRPIQYEGHYYELDGTGQFVYENGVTYRKVDENVVVRTDQEIVDGDTIRLYPLSMGDLDRTSSSSESLQFRPGRTGVQRVELAEDSNLTLQTDLSEKQWEDILAGEVTDENVHVSNGELDLTLEAGTYWLECTPVGIRNAPNQNEVPRDDQKGPNSPEFNPAGNGSIQLTKINKGGEGDVNLTFVGRGVNETWTQARVNFHDAHQPGQNAVYVSYMAVNGTEISPASMKVGDEYEEIDPDIFIGEDEETVVEIGFDGGRTGSWFVISFIGDDGTRYQYFASIPTGS